MALSDAIELLGAAGVGGLATQYFSRGIERRQTRVAARTAWVRVETVRWVDGSKENTFVVMADAVRAFEIAAMVAGLPRDLVEAYTTAARAAHACSWAFLSDGNDPTDDDGTPLGGFIPSDLADLTSDVARLVTDYLWSPFTTWFRLDSRLKQHTRWLEKCAATDREIKRALDQVRRAPV